MMAYEKEFGAKVSDAQKAVRLAGQNVERRLGAAQQALDNAGQKVEEAGEVARSAVSVFYQIDRFWRSVEDFVNSNLQFTTRY